MDIRKILKNPKTYLVVGGVTIVGIGAYLLLRGGGGGIGGKTVLQISSGANGHTDPPSGMYEFNASDYITITAVPDTGYHVDQWIVDGNSQGTNNTITLSMSSDHNVVVTFTTGTPTERIPYSITVSPVGMVNVKQPYTGQFYIQAGIAKWHVKPVADYAQYEGPDGYNPAEITFTVLDVYGQPCANVPLLIATDAVDYNNGEVVVPSKVTTGTDGTATVSLFYRAVNPSDWSKKRLYYKEQVFWVWANPTCLAEGTVRGCGLWTCTGEEVGVSYNQECPNATVFGSQYEFQTVPLPHVVRAIYEKNTQLQAQAQLSCWIGIKAPPSDHIVNSGGP